jgi:hypothetical protein
LLELSEFDAAAAVFASRKAEDLPTKIGMTLQAVALSEKSGPLLELRHREFNSFAIEGRPKKEIVNDLVHRIVLEKLADTLGDPRAKPDEMLPFLDEVLGDAESIKSVVTGIDEAVHRTLRESAEIQRESTGSTHIWELIDA